MAEKQPPVIPFVWSTESLSTLIPPIKSWRPYRREDRDAIAALRRPSTEELFGYFKLDDMIELSAHRLVMENMRGEIIACLCLRNYPNIPALLPEVWTEVIWRQYLLSELNHENTLFVHMLVWDRRYNWELLCYLLKTMFLSLFRLQYVVLVVLPTCENAALLTNHLMGKYFIKVKPATSKAPSAQTLYIAFRQKILPSISVRRARNDDANSTPMISAEDNDDLVGIIDRTAPILKKEYGEFYISEIILSQSTSREIIVAEINNEAVGMMCLNSDISIDRLFALYDIRTFHGFRKHTLDENKNTMSSHPKEFVHDDPAKPIRDRLKSELQDEELPVPELSDHELSDFFPDNESDNQIASCSSTTDVTRDYLQLLNNSLRLSSFESVDDLFELFSNGVSLAETFDRKGLEPSLTHPVTAKAPIDFNGPTDAFLIELHGMRHDIDERLAITLLEAAFQTFPNLSYCLLTVPSHRRYFPLLSYFVRVVARWDVHPVKRSLVFAAQRNVLFSAIVVRLATADDYRNIHGFLAAIANGDWHAEDMMLAIKLHEKRRAYPYVMLAEGSVIGVCILLEYNDVAVLRHNYDVDAHMNSECHTNVCVLQMMILQPSFMVRLPFILSEFFRQSGFTGMFYMLKDIFSKINVGMNESSVNTMLQEMIPIRPRRRIVYTLDKLHDYQWPPKYVLDNHCKPFGLYYQNVNSCTKRKLVINERIVVVGCSTTALAFLEGMIFHNRCKDVYCTHLTMISPNGFAVSVFEDMSELAKSFAFKEIYTPDHIRRLAFRTWVNLVYGNVTKIDRTKKIIYVDSRSFLYDRIYMFCGLQFDYPIKLKTPAKQPKNLAFLNNALEAELILIKTKAILKNYKQYNIIVYGENLFCYTCLNALITSNVNPENITFIRPRSKESSTTTMFNDSFVDELMDNILQDSGVKVLENHDIVDWKVDKDNTIAKIQVESDLRVLELQCSMLICIERQIVARRTILVLNNAGLVFDGRLVINENCQTNDPNIYAAGPMTKYKRSLFADNMRHEYYSSLEIGSRLARKTLEELDPLRSYNEKSLNTTIPGTVHKYKRCKVIKHPVMGGLNFVWIRTPGRPVPLELAKNRDNYGFDLITGQSEIPSEVNYCRVHLDTNNRVESIVSLTQQPINAHKYIALWDRHESILNSLRMRFESNLIPDLHEYFTSPWIYLLYHDRYATQLCLKNYEALNKMYYPEPNFVSEISKSVVKNKWQDLTEKQRTVFVENFMSSVYENQVKTNLLDFIAKHIDELSMFYDTNRVTIQK